ncbi:hypothetical protein AVEN_80766-1 [Araneus ventricosus]|uniref:Uncharacterized protein n=1 Tax=Araneus ventricosus TaxID=182803 RepID=A0A4Y2I393_ARAVE|nr:hypothetical protein AVEN_80766-1 [Araneus ventricosus]
MAITGKYHSTQIFFDTAEHLKVAKRTKKRYSHILCSVCDFHSAISENNVFMSYAPCRMYLLTVVGLPCLSATIKSVRPSSSKCWHHFSMAGRSITCGTYTADTSL